MKKPTNKELTAAFVNAKATSESYRTRNVQIEKELTEAKNKIAEQERQIRWMQTLSQNLSEAVCAYMRSR